MDTELSPEGVTFLEELRRVVRETWTSMWPVPVNAQWLFDLESRLRKIEEGVALAVVQRAFPHLLLARSKESVLSRPVEETSMSFRFGDLNTQDVAFEWTMKGLRVSLALGVIWPGLTTAQRVSGWMTISQADARRLRDKLTSWIGDS